MVGRLAQLSAHASISTATRRKAGSNKSSSAFLRAAAGAGRGEVNRPRPLLAVLDRSWTDRLAACQVLAARKLTILRLPRKLTGNSVSSPSPRAWR